MVPLSDSDSSDDDYHMTFRDAPGHKESYYQDMDAQGSGSGKGVMVTNNRKEADSDGDDSYHSEVLKSPISTDCDSDGGGKPVFPQFNESSTFGAVHLEVGMEFATLSVFKEAVRDYTISNCREIKWVKNEPSRARAKCKKEGCPWTIFCSKNESRKSYHIKTYLKDHTCCKDNTNQANRKWVVKILKGKLRVLPNMNHTEIYDFFKQDYHVMLEDSKITRALREARQLVEGSEREQYDLIWDYGKELLRSNPHSTVQISTTPLPNSPPQFKRFYVCLDACKKGFKAGCRPFIGLDGCFLKGYFGGQLLSAVGQDANNHIFVIAYAVVDVENKENWKWFLTLLQDDLGEHEQHGWNFISDMQKV